jgi:hypothetical protein
VTRNVRIPYDEKGLLKTDRKDKIFPPLEITKRWLAPQSARDT